MDNSGGRRVLVPVQMQGVNMNVHQSGGSSNNGGGGQYAVLQLVGFTHSPTGNTINNAIAQPTIIWSPTAGASASPLPSPRNANTASPLPSPRAQPQPQPQPSEAEKAQQQQQQQATTFVQADTSSFKEVVQKLTGASDEKKLPITMPARYLPRSAPASAPPAPSPAPAPAFEVGPRKATFKPQLHERRQNLRRLGGINVSPNPPSPLRVNLNGRMIQPPEILSPSMLDFPSLALSPVTPLGGDPFIDCPCPSSATSTTSTTSTSSCSLTEEDKAIAEKGFYLHPSPLHTPRGSEPELLPLFPLRSPRDSDASS